MHISDTNYLKGPQKSIVSIGDMVERTVILHTYSKSFCMTGWRLGAAIGPSDIIEQISKLNTNDEACTTHFIQYAGISLSSPQAQQFLHNELIPELRMRRDTLHTLLMEIPGFKVVGVPTATFYLYVNVTEAIKNGNYKDHEHFRKYVKYESYESIFTLFRDILENTGVSVCHREHFGSRQIGETEYYVRFAYSGIGVDVIREGLTKLKDYMIQKLK